MSFVIGFRVQDLVSRVVSFKFLELAVLWDWASGTVFDEEHCILLNKAVMSLVILDGTFLYRLKTRWLLLIF